MIKAAIFDLDSTLIFTQKIKKSIFSFIKEMSGVDDNFVIKVYSNARDKNGKMIFSLESLKHELKKSVEKFNEKKWEEFEKSFEVPDKDLLIGGAEELFNFFKQNNIPVYLLTLGVEKWQKNKMKLGGLMDVLGDDFKNIKYTTEEDAKKGKIKEIEEILKELNLENCEELLFFNDRPDETSEIIKAFPSIRVFIRREKKDKRYSDKDFEDLAKNKNIIKVSEDLNLIDDIKKLL